MRIKKFKITSEKKYEVHYQKKSTKGWDDHIMISAEEPSPELLQSLDDLPPHLACICELPTGDWQVNPYTIKGLSFSYGGENETLGVTVTFTRTLRYKNSPLNLNAPHMIEESYSESGDDKHVMNTELLNTIYAIMSHVQEYLDGKRAQLSLFVEKVV
jgi:hypothetical protein